MGNAIIKLKQCVSTGLLASALLVSNTEFVAAQSSNDLKSNSQPETSCPNQVKDSIGVILSSSDNSSSDNSSPLDTIKNTEIVPNPLIPKKYTTLGSGVIVATSSKDSLIYIFTVSHVIRGVKKDEEILFATEVDENRPLSFRPNAVHRVQTILNIPNPPKNSTRSNSQNQKSDYRDIAILKAKIETSSNKTLPFKTDIRELKRNFDRVYVVAWPKDDNNNAQSVNAKPLCVQTIYQDYKPDESTEGLSITYNKVGTEKNPNDASGSSGGAVVYKDKDGNISLIGIHRSLNGAIPIQSFLDVIKSEYQKYQTAYDEIIKPNTSSNTPMGKPPKQQLETDKPKNVEQPPEQTKKPNTNGSSNNPRYRRGRW
jgi:hypothetical protein